MEEVIGITEARVAAFHGEGTGNAFVRAIPLFMTAALLSAASEPYLDQVISYTTASQLQTSGSQSSVVSIRGAKTDIDQDIFIAMVGLQDRLLSAQTELDEDSKSILYSNLWNLYE